MYVVIGGGLALNDTGFILVQATCPTSSLGRSATLFPSLVGGSASPFIDKGDGFTGERERVRMFLSLVAHADEGSDDGRRSQYC